MSENNKAGKNNNYLVSICLQIHDQKVLFSIPSFFKDMRDGRRLRQSSIQNRFSNEDSPGSENSGVFFLLVA